MGSSHMWLSGAGGSDDGMTYAAAPASRRDDSFSGMPMPGWLNESSTITRCRSAVLARPSFASLFAP